MARRKVESSPDARTWTFISRRTRAFKRRSRDRGGRAVLVRLHAQAQSGPAWTLSEFLKDDDIKVLNEHTISSPEPIVFAVPIVAALVVRDESQPVLANEQGGPARSGSPRTPRQRPFKIKRWEQGVLYRARGVDGYWKGGRRRTHRRRDLPDRPRVGRSARRGDTREADIVEASRATISTRSRRCRASSCRTSGMTTFGIQDEPQKGVTRTWNLQAVVRSIRRVIKIYNATPCSRRPVPANATRGYVSCRDLRQDLGKAKEFLPVRYPNGGPSRVPTSTARRREMGLSSSTPQKLNIR